MTSPPSRLVAAAPRAEPRSAAAPTAPASSTPDLAAWAATPWLPVRTIGQGDWTTILLARPRNLSSDAPADYVLKTPRSDVDPERGLRLLAREALVSRRVSSPHLAPVLASQLERSPRYLVLPWLPGATLAEILARHRRLPVERAVWFARQTALGLGALHAGGWRHGDVKPANLQISPEGRATLLDLGFARCLSGVERGDVAWTGSLAYAAPEALCPHEPAVAPSDIYSLGVMLYEMLSGERPFAGAPHELALAHLRETPPPLRSHRPALDVRLDCLVEQMLRKEPLRRPTANETLARLIELEVDRWSGADAEQPAWAAD